MKVIIACIALLSVVLLAGCDNTPVYRVQEPGVNGTVISRIEDYGEIDGCKLKYIYTHEHNDFWFIRCPEGSVSTHYYHSSGKNTS